MYLSLELLSQYLDSSVGNDIIKNHLLEIVNRFRIVKNVNLKNSHIHEFALTHDIYSIYIVDGILCHLHTLPDILQCGIDSATQINCPQMDQNIR